MYPCGGCGNCNMCCDPCGNSSCGPCGFDQCGQSCGPCGFDQCYPPANPYIGLCNPCAGPTYLTPRFCDTQEVAIYPIRTYSAQNVQQQTVMSALLCGPKCPTSPDWETIMATNICCSTSILQIVPKVGETVAMPSNNTMYIDGLDIYLNPTALKDCPCGAEVSVTITGVGGNETGGTSTAEITRTYRPAVPFCIQGGCPTKVNFKFTGENTAQSGSANNDAPNPLFFNVLNNGSVSSAHMHIKIRYC